MSKSNQRFLGTVVSSLDGETVKDASTFTAELEAHYQAVAENGGRVVASHTVTLKTDEGIPADHVVLMSEFPVDTLGQALDNLS